MARLPPPCHAVHRRLRLSDLRAGDDPPLSNRLCREDRKSCSSRSLQTKGTCPSDPRGTSPTPSQRSSEGSPQPWQEACPDVHADAVGLGRRLVPRRGGSVKLDASPAVEDLSHSKISH